MRAGYPPEDILDEADLAAAKWAWQNNRAAGRGADTLPGAKRLFLPMRTGRGAVGVVGLDSDKPGPLLTPDQRRLLDALIDQGALAIERVNLVEDMGRVKRNVEAERLRPRLLTSISHDLKTPLAAVLAAAGTLRDLFNQVTDAEKADLLATVIDESERLNRFIANLLDMTKLESGAIAPNTAPHDLHEIVDTALRRAEKILARHRVELDIGATCRCLNLDAVLFEQVLFNLLDNASKVLAGRLDNHDPWLAGRRFSGPPDRWTKAVAFRRRSWSASSTSSTACKRPIRCGREQGLALPYPADSSRRWAAPLWRQTAPIGRAPCSPSAAGPAEARSLDTAA